MDASISLTMVAGDDLGALNNALASFLDHHKIGGRPAYMLQLVVEEIVTNIADHGVDGAGATIAVDLSRSGPELRGTIADDAQPFDPLARGKVDTTGTLEERQIGGLGIHLVREMTDSLAYTYKNGRNELAFTIKLEKETR